MNLRLLENRTFGCSSSQPGTRVPVLVNSPVINEGTGALNHGRHACRQDCSILESTPASSGVFSPANSPVTLVNHVPKAMDINT